MRVYRIRLDLQKLKETQERLKIIPKRGKTENVKKISAWSIPVYKLFRNTGSCL